MEIDIVIKKTIVYTSVTIIVVGLYFGLVVGFGNLLVYYSNIQSQPVTIVATLLIAGVFIPIKNGIQGRESQITG